jgi:hypothetical protein
VELTCSQRVACGRPPPLADGVGARNSSEALAVRDIDEGVCIARRCSVPGSARELQSSLAIEAYEGMQLQRSKCNSRKTLDAKSSIGASTVAFHFASPYTLPNEWPSFVLP